MKIKVNETFKGIDGIQPLPSETGRVLALKDICINAILTPEEKDDEKKKLEKYSIFKKLRASSEDVVLTAEEITIIKRSIARVYAPLIMGQAFEMLEENHHA